MNSKQAKKENYKKERAAEIEYIVIHYTANNGDTAEGNANYFANNKVYTSAHYFVDEKEIWQSVKESDTAFHCGAKKYRHDKCRNANSIGIEMCSRRNTDGKYYIKKETVERTVELTKSLMKKYNIDVKHVLRHYDVTGKNCPLPFVEQPVLWKKFIQNLVKDTEMEKQITIKLNGVKKNVNVIEKDGYNYIKMQDLRDEKISVEYNVLPVIKVR
ncbi:MAG: N-acetylmuramoyl-L-alanine amidase family protein [Bacillota bacterium]|jgi:N-acetylmuramoyl-L-alanine amidase CwlA